MRVELTFPFQDGVQLKQNEKENGREQELTGKNYRRRSRKRAGKGQRKKANSTEEKEERVLTKEMKQYRTMP